MGVERGARLILFFRDSCCKNVYMKKTEGGIIKNKRKNKGGEGITSNIDFDTLFGNTMFTCASLKLNYKKKGVWRPNILSLF